jgi:hypothetical protein
MEQLPRMRGYKIKLLSLFDPLSPHPLPGGEGVYGTAVGGYIFVCRIQPENCLALCSADKGDLSCMISRVVRVPCPVTGAVRSFKTVPAHQFPLIFAVRRRGVWRVLPHRSEGHGTRRYPASPYPGLMFHTISAFGDHHAD